MRTHLSKSPGNWRVNVFCVVNVVNCSTRGSGVCFKISSGDTELNPELCLRSLCSYNWQFTLQTLHLQQCELIIFVGIVIEWRFNAWIYGLILNEAREKLHLELNTHLIALDILSGNVDYEGNKVRNFKNIASTNRGRCWHFVFRNLGREVYFERRLAPYRFKAEGHVTVFTCEMPYYTFHIVIFCPRKSYVVTQTKRFVYCNLGVAACAVWYSELVRNFKKVSSVYWGQKNSCFGQRVISAIGGKIYFRGDRGRELGFKDTSFGNSKSPTSQQRWMLTTYDFRCN